MSKNIKMVAPRVSREEILVARRMKQMRRFGKIRNIVSHEGDMKYNKRKAYLLRIEVARKRGQARRDLRGKLAKELGVNPRRVILNYKTKEVVKVL